MVLRRNYKYAWSLLPAVLVITGNLLGGMWAGLNMAFSLGVLALLEWFVPEDKSNQSDRDDWFPDSLLYAHVIMQVGCLISLGYFVVSYQPDWGLLLLASLSTGINTGGSGIVVAHELVHRKEAHMRFMGKFLLFTAGNFYFFIDHVKGHHRWVGTAHDPATSRKGESVYAFAIRSATGQARSSWHLEVQRLRHKGLNPYGIRNYLVAAVLAGFIAMALVISFAGLKVGLALFIQGFMACFLLEYTNYIEHYGLMRKGTERVTEQHSWQTDKVISRFFLIDLSRHADHHYHASRPYHTLESLKGSPVLPGGYVSMIYFALVPPLFFRKVHPVLDRITETS
jgi:alkane 1-monooxygenase